MGASCIAITLGMYGAEVMTLTVSGGLGLIPVGGTVVTLPQLAGAFLLVAGTVTSQNLLSIPTFTVPVPLIEHTPVPVFEAALIPKKPSFTTTNFLNPIFFTTSSKAFF